jgi:hypothetical protein
VVSSNFYWAGLNENDFTALRQLPKVKLNALIYAKQTGSRWSIRTELQNMGNAPALMVRVKAVREKTGDRILPALYSDNYVSLMPGETFVVNTTVEDADTRGEHPTVVVEGFNVQR